MTLHRYNCLFNFSYGVARPQTVKQVAKEFLITERRVEKAVKLDRGHNVEFSSDGKIDATWGY
jgi:hypothetical protein